MPRISLGLVRGTHQLSLALGHPVPAVRLFTTLSLQTPAGWTPYHRVIVDTGAPISLFTPEMWKDTDYVSYGEGKVGGLVAREECRVPVMLARVNCVLSDGRNSIGPLEIYALLARTNRVPALLGVSGFLERNVLSVNIHKNRASLRSR
jgi:hypothetical protein